MTTSLTSPGSRFRSCEGFTLIEVLIAASLLSLLAMMLMGGVRFGTRVMESGLQRSDQTIRLSAAFGFLRNRLEQALPLERETDDKGDAPIVFEGRSDSLTFIDVTPPYLAVGGYELLTIHTDQHGGRGRLVATWRPYSKTTAPANATPRDTVLFEDTAAVEFTYFGSAAENEPPRWHGAWYDQTSLPSLVRIRIGLRDGRTIPDLIVALRVDNDVS